MKLKSGRVGGVNESISQVSCFQKRKEKVFGKENQFFQSLKEKYWSSVNARICPGEKGG